MRLMMTTTLQRENPAHVEANFISPSIDTCVDFLIVKMLRCKISCFKTRMLSMYYLGVWWRVPTPYIGNGWTNMDTRTRRWGWADWKLKRMRSLSLTHDGDSSFLINTYLNSDARWKSYCSVCVIYEIELIRTFLFQGWFQKQVIAFDL